MTKKNDLVSAILGDKFNLEMMVSQRAKESPKTPEGITVSLLVAILETQNNTEGRGSIYIMV